MTLEKIFAETFNLAEGSVTNSLEFRDIAAWDSLTHMQLIVQLEDTFQVQFSGDEIADMHSVGSVRSTLLSHGVSL